METRWDLIIIGTGAAGLTAANIARGLGLRVACVEADRIGGECSWTGCVPSKALIHAADIAWHLKYGLGGGIRADVANMDAAGALEYVRTTRETMASKLTPAVLRERGIEVFEGMGALQAPHVVEVDGRTLYARHVLIATGSSPRIPPIPGIEDVHFITNTTVFEQLDIPVTLGIIGGGPLGIEMAQAFQRLGSQVTVLERHHEIMPRDDPELATKLREILAAEGVRFVCNANTTRMEPDDHKTRLILDIDGVEKPMSFDEVLLATGRVPNTQSMNLETVGVKLKRGAVIVDRNMRTTLPGVWAAGDVTGRWQFSHIAELEAVTVMRNAVFPLTEAISYKHAGWCTFTSPELASCGENEQQVADSGRPYGVYRYSFADDDRARVDQQNIGIVKVVAHPKTGRIYGAQILGPRAGELIQEYITAMAAGISVKRLARFVHVYPTLSMATQRAGQMWWDAWGKTPATQRMLRRYLRLARYIGHHP